MTLKKLFSFTMLFIISSLSLSQANAGCDKSDKVSPSLKRDLSGMSYNTFKNSKLGGRSILKVNSYESYADKLDVNSTDLKRVLEDIADDRDSDCWERGRDGKKHPKTEHVYNSIKSGSNSNDDNKNNDSGGNEENERENNTGDANKGKSLQVHDGGRWRYVNCEGGGTPKVSDSKRGDWATSGRSLKSGSYYLHCPEKNGSREAVNCECRRGSGERFHINDQRNGNGQSGDVSKHMSGGGKFRGETRYIAPNNGFESCLKVVGGEIQAPCNKDERSSKYNFCMDNSGSKFSKRDHEKGCSAFRLRK